MIDDNPVYFTRVTDDDGNEVATVGGFVAVPDGEPATVHITGLEGPGSSVLLRVGIARNLGEALILAADAADGRTS